MRKNITLSVDIGTSKIKMLGFFFDEDKESSLQLVKKESNGYIRGVKKGRIEEYNDILSFIQDTVEKMQEEYQAKIDKILFSINGVHIESVIPKSNVVVSKADQIVSQDDVDRVLQLAKAVSLPPNREIIGIYGKEFSIDNTDEVKNPIGLKGSRLEAKVILISAFSTFLNNLKHIAEEIKIDYDIIPSPYASSWSVLTQEQKDLGACVVDIGSATTGICVFKDGNLIHLKVIPAGSSNITSDIAIKFQIDFDVAEYIKKDFGSCLINSSSNKKEIVSLEDGREIAFKRKDLHKVITDRIEQIFDDFLFDLEKLNIKNDLPGGIVFTGGGSNLTGLPEFSRKYLKLPSKRGKFREPFLSYISDPAFACSLGMGILSEFENNDALKKEDYIQDKFKRMGRRSSKKFSLLDKFKKLKMFLP